MTSSISYDAAGQPVSLTYTKTSEEVVWRLSSGSPMVCSVSAGSESGADTGGERPIMRSFSMKEGASHS
jgi:hypothetical protein